MSLIESINWLAEEAGKIIGREIKANKSETGLFGLSAPKVFAYAHRRYWAGQEAGISLETKQEWSDKAGVTNTSDRKTENGWWGEPAVFWDIDVNQTSKLKGMVGILAKICQARHSR